MLPRGQVADAVGEFGGGAGNMIAPQPGMRLEWPDCTWRLFTMADSESVRFRGRIVEVAVEQVTLPNGRPMTLEVVRHPGGAAVVALDASNRVCLLRQYRHVVGGWVWELPAGKLDPGEPPATTARRELAEEAGVEAARWNDLGRLVSSPGIFTETIHLYLAREHAGCRWARRSSAPRAVKSWTARPWRGCSAPGTS